MSDKLFLRCYLKLWPSSLLFQAPLVSGSEALSPVGLDHSLLAVLFSAQKSHDFSADIKYNTNNNACKCSARLPAHFQGKCEMKNKYFQLIASGKPSRSNFRTRVHIYNMFQLPSGPAGTQLWLALPLVTDLWSPVGRARSPQWKSHKLLASTGKHGLKAGGGLRFSYMSQVAIRFSDRNHVASLSQTQHISHMAVQVMFRCQ